MEDSWGEDKPRFRQTARNVPVIVQGREGGHSWMGLRDIKKTERLPELRMDQLWNVKEGGGGYCLRSLVGELVPSTNKKNIRGRCCFGGGMSSIWDILNLRLL